MSKIKSAQNQGQQAAAYQADDGAAAEVATEAMTHMMANTLDAAAAGLGQALELLKTLAEASDAGQAGQSAAPAVQQPANQPMPRRQRTL